MSIARKLDPSLWERAKREACEEHPRLCPHSARKMQWSVKRYKELGGRFASKRRSKKNSLRRWTQERWRTFDGRLSEGKRRYLPDRIWAHLSPSQVRRTNRAKHDGHTQWVRQPKDVRETVWRAKRNP